MPATTMPAREKRLLRRHDLVKSCAAAAPSEQTAFSMSVTIRASSMDMLQRIYMDIEQIVKKQGGVI